MSSPQHDYPAHPLSHLALLPEISGAVAACQGAVDRLRRRVAAAPNPGSLHAELTLRAAWYSARLAGADCSLELLRAGGVDDPRVVGAVRVYSELPALVVTWQRAPLQILARLHALAAFGLATSTELGRPRSGGACANELSALVELLVAAPGDTPPSVIAAVVQGELLRIAPFAQANGVVARACARLTLASTGLDPQLSVLMEAGHHDRQPEYLGSSAAYRTGTSDGVRAWLKHQCVAIEQGAALADDLCERTTHIGE